ncbi:ABC transporter ATP-binding protein [Adlercreutzia sp. ZJ473]|uniref:ABC transporter ATP-binding protein n=1 Tax=Adlercreutzia sp. ZJ473 TaxID=2722822 RepID=UPI0015549188|nr:ABC transporter ATP-binding protein [Adlercreutzia sp. ZJ473]
MSIVECVGVKKTYRRGSQEVFALRGVDLTIQSGELVAIVGSSGSGKSTLLHLLGGIDKPTEGSVLIDGVDVTSFDATQSALFRRRKVGLVYQFFNLVPTVDVRRNILMPLLLDGRQPQGGLLEEITHALGIDGLLDAMPAELSGGQQQRVAIARSLVYRPLLLLADEPTGNLDRRSSEEVVDLLKLANRRFHQTTVIVTHDDEVALATDRIVTLEDGCVVGDRRCR